MQFQWLGNIRQCAAADWDALNTADNPFLCHAFFDALESSGCTSAETGWQPCHLLLSDNDRLIAALPLYSKHHSYGEYVFDWSWADAWQSRGLAYYPKLLSAIPFTPSTGPRLLLHPDTAADHPALIDTVVETLEHKMQSEGYSGWHLLFPEKDLSDQLATRGGKQRMACQFHWFNRGYQHFDDFTARFASRKRKQLRKEREKIRAQGITCRSLQGQQITAAIWQHFFACYQLTYLKRSGHHGYLNLDFFQQLADTMPDKLMMVIAEKNGNIIAAALNLLGPDTLYGRYWGCLDDFDFLHFETCYYQGIEFCIREKITRFDAGAQGEHKLQRGFEPVPVWSNHWIQDAELGEAVAQFLKREKTAVEHYIADCRNSLPFNAQNR